MASGFPKLPGYVPIHDPEITSFKKISHKKLEAQNNPRDKEVPLYALPRQVIGSEVKEVKPMQHKSLSQSQYGWKASSSETNVQFEPVFSKLENQVLRFWGFFKESVAESSLEALKVRKLIIFYYLVDNSISIIEPKQSNSGTPQGEFLKRQAVMLFLGFGGNFWF
jgi:hypothetical protein